MNPLNETQEILGKAMSYMKRIPEGHLYIPKLVHMQSRLERPCVLAVAGKVKAGKSSFLNALIGVNLAKVGELETTATINKFTYGVPEDPKHPVKAVWENGMETFETLEFMDSLQGNDEDTLKKAEEIAYLEFRLQHELLKEITLVDTPGTDAVVGEDGDGHQQVTESFFNLRNKHKKQTLACTSEADAVIYLVGAVTTGNARKFLTDFQQASSGSSALNAIGVLSKVDIDEVLLDKRHEQAKYVAESLRDQLHKVVPVSAGLHMAIKEKKAYFSIWQKTLKQIPPKAFQYFFKQESTFLTERKEVIDALYSKDLPLNLVKPLSLEERKALKGDLCWSVFRTIANVLYQTDTPQEAWERLSDIANMEEVESLVKEQFFNRSKIIRCYRILTELKETVDIIYRTGFYEMKQKANLTEQWVNFLKDCSGNCKEEVRKSLLEFVCEHAYSKEKVEELKEEYRKELVIPLENMILDLEEYDANYRMLKKLQSCRDYWSDEEYQELCNLFGLFGERKIKDTIDSYERQKYWEGKSNLLADRKMKAIAEHAVYLYGEF